VPNRRNTLYLIIISALLTGLFTGRAIFFSLAYLFVGLIILAGIWSWFAVRGIGIQRSTRSRRGQVGRKFTEYLGVSNRGISPKVWLEFRDYSTLPNHRVGHVIPPLLPRQQFRWQAETICIIRGEFRLGEIEIISGDPFGLFNMRRRIPASERMIVYPQTLGLSEFHLPVGVLTGGDAQRRFTPHVTTNAAGVRDYVAGDSINRIHWRSSARRNKLIVKEFELDPMVDVWLMVDFSISSLFDHSSVQRASDTGNLIAVQHRIPASTEEYAVTVAASLAEFFLDNERALGFTAYTQTRVMLPPERGGRQLTRILETLAIAHNTAPQSFGEVLSLEIQTFSRGVSLVVVTSDLDTRWIMELEILARRGVRPIIIFIDPTTFTSTVDSSPVKLALQQSGLPHHVINMGDDIRARLAENPFR